MFSSLHIAMILMLIKFSIPVIISQSLRSLVPLITQVQKAFHSGEEEIEECGRSLYFSGSRSHAACETDNFDFEKACLTYILIDIIAQINPDDFS